jgi:hypothetical protein
LLSDSGIFDSFLGRFISHFGDASNEAIAEQRENDITGAHPNRDAELGMQENGQGFRE